MILVDVQLLDNLRGLLFVVCWLLAVGVSSCGCWLLVVVCWCSLWLIVIWCCSLCVACLRVGGWLLFVA